LEKGYSSFTPVKKSEKKKSRIFSFDRDVRTTENKNMNKSLRIIFIIHIIITFFFIKINDSDHRATAKKAGPWLPKTILCIGTALSCLKC
jgi:hypothetical protein